jgi:hypothetical protein
MLHRMGKEVAKSIGGVVAAIRARPRIFASLTTLVFFLHVLLPPLVLSVVRKPLDFFTFNPWLWKLPEYLASKEAPIQRKLEFLPNLALFWFSSDSPYGGTEWGFAVDVTDVGRFILMSVLLGSFFTVWLYRRDQLTRYGWGARAAHSAGVAGVLASILGLSTGPCSVVGCGIPVIPVVGLAFVGLSSGTLKFLAELSRVATAVVLLAMTLGVAYFGWLVSTHATLQSDLSH